MTPRIFIFCAAFFLPGFLFAGTAERFVEWKRLPSGGSVVVAEGEREPRSIGSYAVRLYRGVRADDFAAGMVRPRDGVILRVVVTDLPGGRGPGVIVVMQSAGSGGYRSADAFAVGRDRLRFLASVNDLPPSADLLARLRAAID